MSRMKVVVLLVTMAVVVLVAPEVTFADDKARIHNPDVVIADGPAITDRFPVPVRNVSIVRPASVDLPMGPPSKTTGILLSDGFEGYFPGNDWRVSVNSGKADAAWGLSNYRKSGGNSSIWCAAAGIDSPLGPGDDVPNNMSAWAITGPYDLSDATAGLLNFDFWLETESGYDFFYWMYSTDGTSFDGFGTSTSNGDFEIMTQDLADWGNAGSALGNSQVWFAFLYTTDVSNTSEGAYIDQVSINTAGGGGGGGGGSDCGTVTS